MSAVTGKYYSCPRIISVLYQRIISAPYYISKALRFIPFNLNPGKVQTERLLQDPPVGFDASDWSPPEVIGQVVNWLATSPEADKYRGKSVDGQELCDELGLLPGWSLKRGEPAT